MKIKLNKAKAERLVCHFNTLKEQLPLIRDNIQKQIDAKLEINGIIQPEEVDTINAYLEPVLEMLNQYTLGFPSYLRSVGKTEESKKPDAETLNSIRDILSQAREIKEDFDWMKEHFNQQVMLHNMALGDFRIVSVMETFQEPEPPQGATGLELTEEDQDAGQNQETTSSQLTEPA